jgi:hypothetical protein
MPGQIQIQKHIPILDNSRVSKWKTVCIRFGRFNTQALPAISRRQLDMRANARICPADRPPHANMPEVLAGHKLPLQFLINDLKVPAVAQKGKV